MALTVPLSEIVEKSSNRLLGKHESWGRVLLGDVATVLNGFAFKSSEFSNSGEVPLIRIRDVGKDRSETTYLGEYDARYVVEPGELLVGMDGDFNCARWRGPRGLLNQRVCKITLKSDTFLPKFLDYTLPGYLKAINDVTSSVTVKHLSSRSIEEIPLPLPPKEVQERLVAEIEKQFSRLDEAVANLKRVKANLKRYKASVLKAAVEGKLTEDWRMQHPNVEPASKLLERILAERRAKWKEKGKGKYEEPVKPDTTTLQPPPKNWTWASVEQITENFDGKRVPLKSADRDKRAGSYPYYGASGIIDDIDDYLFKGNYLLIAEDGANLLSRSTPIAFQASGKFWVNNHAHVVQTLGGVPLEYLATFLNGEDLKFSITGSAQPKLTQASLSKIPVLLPPLMEQQDIVDEVERRLSVIKELEAALEANLTRADRLRQSILGQAFSGKLLSNGARG